MQNLKSLISVLTSFRRKRAEENHSDPSSVVCHMCLLQKLHYSLSDERERERDVCKMKYLIYFFTFFASVNSNETNSNQMQGMLTGVYLLPGTGYTIDCYLYHASLVTLIT